MLALRATVLRWIVIAAGVSGCRHPEATYPAIAAPCTTERVGTVIVEGGTAEDVPQLAVLEGTLDNAERTARIAQVSSELLRARGYPRAEVSVERRVGCGVELVAHVNRGPRFAIERIAFVTDDAFPEHARLATIEDALGTINAVGGAYVADRLERALETLARRYYEAGWLEADIEPPRAVFDEQRGAVAIEIPIQAGRRFRIGNVSVTGGRRTTREAVLEALGLVGGQYYDAARVREGIVRARRQVDDRLEMRMQIEADRIDLEAVVGDAP